MTKKPRIGFIGAGKVGASLAVFLSERGYDVVSVASRSFSSAQRLASLVSDCSPCKELQGAADTAELVFITTLDDAIGPVVAGVRWRPGQSVVHCSGAASLDILEPARRAGAMVGGFHPLQTFSSIEQALTDLPSSTFGLEADEPLLSMLVSLAEAVSGNWIRLSAEDKVLYHAGAIISGILGATVLVSASADLWGGFGVPPNEVVKAVLPSMRGTLRAIEQMGLPDSVGGPYARGDIGTIQKHIDAIRERVPSVLSLYKELGRHCVPMALAKGSIDCQIAEQIYRILKIGSM